MNQRHFAIVLAFAGVLFGLWCERATASEQRPHILFVMADDMGWGQAGYCGHPRLKTPNLEAMAASGVRFEQFYAGGPVFSDDSRSPG